MIKIRIHYSAHRNPGMHRIRDAFSVTRAGRARGRARAARVVALYFKPPRTMTRNPPATRAIGATTSAEACQRFLARHRGSTEWALASSSSRAAHHASFPLAQGERLQQQRVVDQRTMSAHDGPCDPQHREPPIHVLRSKSANFYRSTC